MAVANTTECNTYSGTGTTGPFSISFTIFDNTQLTVYKVNNSTGAKTSLVLTSDYTVSAALDSITTTATVASGYTLYIWRAVPYTQGAVFRAQRDFDPAKNEDAFDKADMRDLQLKRVTDRAMQIPEFEDPNSYEMTLPAAALRAGKFLGFDSSGSLTTISSEPGLTAAPWYDVKTYGAVGNGTTNDTAAIQSALTAAAANNGVVYVSPGTYKITSVTVSNGVRGFFGPGTIKDSATATYGVVNLAGPNAIGGAAVTDCYFSLRITVGHGASHCIYADQAIQCTFENCVFSGFTDNDAAGATGFTFLAGSKQNRVSGNRVIFSTGTPTNAQVGITCIADTIAFAGYFSGSGTITEPSNPCEEFVISNNYIYKGSHGISLNGGYYCSIVGNVIEGQRDRCIILEPCTRYCTVTGNALKNFGSSAVTMGYGSGFNVVSSNNCRSLVAGGESAIQAYVGCLQNIIIGNRIETTTNYGIYIAVNATQNVVTNNHIYLFRLAAIGLESDWESPLPVGATYSRPNFGASPSGQWAYSNTQTNVIKDNVIYASIGGTTCGIYLAQIGTVAPLNDNIIQGNRIESSSLTHYLMLFEENSGSATTNQLIGNSFLSYTTSKVSFTRSVRLHFNYCVNNQGIDIGSVSDITFADGDTSPSVGLGGFFTFSSSSPTNVTTFDDAAADQEIFVRLDSNTTLKYDVNKLRLKGAVDASGNANCFMRFKYISSIWFETSRNF